MNFIIKDRTVAICLFITLAILSVTSILIVRVSNDTKVIGKQNRAFLGNFSDYMRCLVVVDEPKYDELGKEKYFDTCDVLLFRGTKLKPHTHPPTPTTSTTTGSVTTKASNTIGG